MKKFIKNNLLIKLIENRLIPDVGVKVIFPLNPVISWGTRDISGVFPAFFAPACFY